MTDEKVREKLKSALEQLYQKDFSLISRKCSERSIVFRLGLYLAKEFEGTGFDIDCEYNKNGDKPKALIGKRFNYPDIIIHKRECNDNNLLVIEVKTPNDMKTDHLQKDRIKLVGFTGEIPYSYQQGVHIYISKAKCCVIWYKEGNMKDRWVFEITDAQTLQRVNNNQRNCTFENFYPERLN